MRSVKGTRSVSVWAGTVEAFMERIGPAPDRDMFMDFDQRVEDNCREAALAGRKK